MDQEKYVEYKEFSRVAWAAVVMSDNAADPDAARDSEEGENYDSTDDDERN